MKKIRALREKRNMSQKDLADKLSIDRSTVAKWETTNAFPRAPMLPTIAKILRCMINAFF